MRDYGFYRLMDDLLAYNSSWQWTEQVGRNAGDIRFKQTEGYYVYDLDLPGVAPEDLKATVDANVLTLEYQKNGKTRQESISFGNNLNLGNMKISLKLGVLTIKVPLKEEAQKRTIKIDVE